jgi:putative ATP-dependent endonuclease of OLD family
MQLRTLLVENYRGIRQARLDFDAVTVLIGENDCGKTSLLEAIDRALAPGNGGVPVFEPADFHRPGGRPETPVSGPIRIELVFQEPAPGVWDGPDYAPLASLFGSPGRRPRQLSLSLLGAAPDATGDPDLAPVPARWEIHCQGSGRLPCRDDADLLDRVRALVPFIWLRSGSLFNARPDAHADTPNGRPELASLAAELEARYQALITGASAEPMGKLQAGYEAALSHLALHRHASATGNGARPVIAEILGQRERPAGRRAVAAQGSAAEKIGLLILTAAILRHLPEALAPGAHPILALEDPEAHLHPMTLASVWSLLDEIAAQKIVTTQSETLLAEAPLRAVRRLTRHQGLIRQWQVHPGALEAEELRKMSYHLRSRRGVASFARCWLLVEGETEFWMLPELARLCGYDLDQEGVACVEFAQCGLSPLIKVAREWGIEWHVLADGDEAGRHYAETTRAFLHGEAPARRLTALRERDMEHCFWQHGYAGVFLDAAAVHVSPAHRVPPRGVINRAIKRHSKPYMAIEMIMAASASGSPGVPKPLRQLIETCVDLARNALHPRAEANEGDDYPGQERRRAQHGRAGRRTASRRGR